MSVKNCDEAEEIAEKFLGEKFSYYDIRIDSVDFDGEFFLVNGFNEEKHDDDLVKTRFIVKIKTDGNVVGWKVT